MLTATRILTALRVPGWQASLLTWLAFIGLSVFCWGVLA